MNPLDFALVADENTALKSSFSLKALETLRAASVDVVPPFLIVLERKQDRILHPASQRTVDLRELAPAAAGPSPCRFRPPKR